MKLITFFLAVCFVVSCTSQPVANAVDENKKAKNKQTAIINEVTLLTTLAQKLERQGRGMEIYRQANNAANDRECNIAMEDGQKQLKDYEARANSLPDNFKTQLIPLTNDLNICVSCDRKALESCVKSRAAINKIIKEIYP